MQQTTKAHIYVIIATIFIAGSFLASYKLSNTIDAISLTLYRFVLALIFLSPLIIFNKKRLKAVPKFLPKAMIISLFYSLYFIGMFKALEYTTVLNTGSIYTLVPLITAILCIFFFKEKIPFKQLIIYIIGIISTLIVVFKADLELLLKFSLNQGDIIFLIASLSMALYSIFLKVLYKKDDDIIVLVYSTLIAGIIWMSFTMWILDIPYEWEKVHGNLLFSMLYLVIATTILTLFLYQKATLVLGPKKVMAYIYLSPSLVALIMFVFEKQTISLGVLIGIILSTIATIIILRQKT
ncbi:DMT family transporter [Aliarcobacter thereius]|uniref:EamA-like transporter family protein n=1 Tax=Aliarcobacter thereius LMG 24486 TaxID=1032240 RepID=A0A1C7WPW6_9BACT|nr:DMT family transporter [Aliarcobacter thereius]OCL95679.1 EamA-like transporter family protein [Aliarcobacter thereius LMG 24486]QBF16336.1 putative membrane protein, putative permease (EamA domain) [Aliarcobacter thereius LMG 24486]TLS91606.1 DMT family transporter [Aliarcobacter thereius]